MSLSAVLLTIALIPVAFIVIFCILYSIIKIILFLTFKPYDKAYTYNVSDLPDETKKLKIFDYNCFWRPWLLHIGTIEHVRERSELLSERLDDFDIICLNESFHFGSFVAKDFIEKMQKKGFKYVVTTPRVPLFSRWVVDSGVSILSRYPITETDHIAYKRADYWCWFAMKSCVYARIQISKVQHVNVFATHLQATSRIKDEIHIDQYRDINYLMMKHCSNDNAPIFLMGDMNTSSINTKCYNDMIEGFKLPNYKLIDPTKPPEEEERTIDYILVFESKDETKFNLKNYNVEFDRQQIDEKPYSNLSDHPSLKGVFEFE